MKTAADLYVNGKLRRHYCSLGHARRGMRALYDNGKVLPFDEVHILCGGFIYR